MGAISYFNNFRKYLTFLTIFWQIIIKPLQWLISEVDGELKNMNTQNLPMNRCQDFQVYILRCQDDKEVESKTIHFVDVH